MASACSQPAGSAGTHDSERDQSILVAITTTGNKFKGVSLDKTFGHDFELTSIVFVQRQLLINYYRMIVSIKGPDHYANTMRPITTFIGRI